MRKKNLKDDSEFMEDGAEDIVEQLTKFTVQWRDEIGIPWVNELVKAGVPKKEAKKAVNYYFNEMLYNEFFKYLYEGRMM